MFFVRSRKTLKMAEVKADVIEGLVGTLDELPTVGRFVRLLFIVTTRSCFDIERTRARARAA